MEVEKKEEVKETRLKEKRRPFGVPQSRLTIDASYLDPAFHYRWINDEPGRLPLAQQASYQFVTPDEVGRVSVDRDDNRVKEIVGVARDEKTSMYAYLMKVPMEYYLEDQAARSTAQDKFDEAIRQGTLEARPGDGRYVPQGGISYKTNKIK